MISIITVGMNHRKYLEALYGSLYGEGRPETEFEAIYVDNCSTDGSVEWLQEKYPQVRLIVNTKPLGFGENNNKGVMASKGEFIAIINPDIVLQKESIDRLCDFLDKHKEIGIVAPQLINPDLSIQYSVRSFLSLKFAFYRFVTSGNDKSENKEMRAYLCKDLDFCKSQPVDWAMGAALMLSRENYAQLGGFDQDYFLYIEDEDLGLRSWKLGKPVWYLPESKMIHNHLRGSMKLGKKSWLHFKSIILFLRKHGCHIPSYRIQYLNQHLVCPHKCDSRKPFLQ